MDGVNRLLEIRRLREGDVLAYRAMMLEGYERYPNAFTATVAERAFLPLAWWTARVGLDEAADEMVIGAFRNGEPIGAAGLALEVRPKTRHKATLFGMYVAENGQRAGVGGRLVTAVLDLAREQRGVNLVQLTVTEGNDTALRLYERAGFVVFAHEPRAVVLGDGYGTKIHMWYDLLAESART